MEFQEMINRTHMVWKYYIDLDKERKGTEWSRGEYVKALIADVGVLVKCSMAKDGLRNIENVDEKMKHEMGDILSALIIIADRYDIDLENAFTETMSELEERGKNLTLGSSHSL